MKQEIKERIELINKGIVPAGYKKTPVGICPIEWETSKLSELTTFVGGGTPSTKNRSYWEGNIPWISSSDVSDEGIYNIFVKKFINEESINNSATKLIPKDSILVVTRVGVGKLAINTVEICTSQDFTNLINIKINKKFLAFYLKELINKNLKNTQGTSIKGITTKELGNYEIFSNNILEQEKIAEILDCATRQVELQEQLVDKLKVQKKAFMQKLLTPQPDWQKDKLEKLINEGLITLYRGKVISKEDIKKFPGNYPIYSSSVINNGEMGEYGKYMFDEELITWSIDGGGNFFYRNKHKFSVTNVCGYIKINTNYFNYKFLAEELIYLHSKLSFDYMLKAHPSVIKKIYTINYPNLKEQTKIAKLALNLDKQIELQQKLLEQYKLRQKALMQLLLTGIVRVCK